MTMAERADWYQMALTVIGARCDENTLTVAGHTLPEVCWRYEITLQAKDATIAALVKACNTFVETLLEGEYRGDVATSIKEMGAFKAAIKGATDGN